MAPVKENTEVLADTAAQGRHAETPFVLLGGLTVGIGVVAALLIAVGLLLYYLV